jgi:hypothetical protein
MCKFRICHPHQQIFARHGTQCHEGELAMAPIASASTAENMDTFRVNVQITHPEILAASNAENMDTLRARVLTMTLGTMKIGTMTIINKTTYLLIEQ